MSAPIGLFHEYVEEQTDEQGKVSGFHLRVPDSFNFAYDVIDLLGEETPDRRALSWRHPDGRRHDFSFAEIRRQSDRAAAFMLELGIRRGDRVMLILKRHYEFWFAIIGLHKIGAVAIPATHQLQVKDVVYRLRAAEIKAVVVTADGSITASVEEAEQQVSPLIKIVAQGTRDGWASFDQGLDTAPPFQRPAIDQMPQASDPMLLYFTSGTTGMPKMVVHDYRYPIGHLPTARYWHNVDPDGLHLTVSETGWAKSVWGKLYGQWLMEAGIYVYDYDRFDARDLLARIAADRVTTFCAPPTIYRFLIREDLKAYDLSALQHCTIAGEALNPEVYERFLEATGLELKEGYGQTETTLAAATYWWMPTKPGSMGKPSPLFPIVLLGDQDQLIAAAGQAGEICIRTEDSQRIPGMFRGYHKDADLTASVWHDGYYHTGDLAWQDEDGYLWFVGRSDDIIKSSGYRIGPFEVESVLMEHPAVLECAVTGEPDPVRGQAVKATIVLMRGYTPSDALRLEIQNHVKKMTAPYKYPRIVEFVDALPKTISGKIRRVEIRGGKTSE